MPRFLGLILGIIAGAVFNIAVILPNMKGGGSGAHGAAAITGMICGIFGAGIGVTIGGLFTRKD
ncbi:hypothetical protein [Gimesia maris]|jgi:hypothetical protein|uniref:Uncharacterized protein n=1 Tax=Gimesia maris TaxID=122 RepID=A0A3D3R7B7_9PLAN|nr:hypothetical protein [Gimesia maris]MAC51589.1 hypothetical protein [Gimesia sp.]QDT81050.1 hypothetical protein Mal35_45280 [Gimesia maris]HCO24771.1 hypothetical protein [Gimesia maris]|tara:strand:- start:55070 stop:55261 length:192 start_codon:yes stop_codon:yes gene_type:complete